MASWSSAIRIFYIVRIIQQIKINHEEINSNLFIFSVVVRYFAGIGIHYPDAAEVYRKKRQLYGK